MTPFAPSLIIGTAHVGGWFDEVCVDFCVFPPNSVSRRVFRDLSCEGPVGPHITQLHPPMALDGLPPAAPPKCSQPRCPRTACRRPNHLIQFGQPPAVIPAADQLHFNKISVSA